MTKIIWQGSPRVLPISITHKPEDSDEQVYYLAGSAFTNGQGSTRIIGFKAVIDDTVIVKTEVYSNTDNEHRATVPGMNTFKMPFNLEMHEVDGNSVPLVDKEGTLQVHEVSITIDKLTDSTRTDKNDNLIFAVL